MKIKQVNNSDENKEILHSDINNLEIKINSWLICVRIHLYAMTVKLHKTYYKNQF